MPCDMRFNLATLRRKIAAIRLPRLMPATLALAFFCVFMRAAQMVVARAPVRSVLTQGDGGGYLLVPDILTFLFSIHGLGLSLNFFWTPLTYIFLHGSATHLALNLAGLLTFGQSLERDFGKRVLLGVFFISGIIGGLGWVAFKGLDSPHPCVGASAAVLGVVGACAALKPREEFVFTMPFFNPFIRAWELAAFLTIANALELFLGRGHIAYSAHLFGIISGALCGLFARWWKKRKTM
jgi:Uncharacterized membrane protein (homolog of Drosophila rhomboid)